MIGKLDMRKPVARLAANSGGEERIHGDGIPSSKCGS